MKFIELSKEEQRNIIRGLKERTGMSEQILEKDWWVSAVMRALFALPYANQISFKGGTSLSKCWGLIDRFSEDIDIAVAREFLGYGGELSRTQISDKLRRASCSFVREKLQFDIRDMMIEQGLPLGSFKVAVNITPVSTVDPEVINVEYDSIFETLPYVKNAVKIEVSGRSMNEPLENVRLRSRIEDELPNAAFTESKITVPTVKPERTFLEKVCLLHEEFSKEVAEVRVNRMSRHLYDIAMMMKTDIADRALADEQLFENIVEHRRKFIGLKGFDYSTLCTEKICIVPPDGVIDKWKQDYIQMCNSMMYGDYPDFDELMAYICELQKRLRKSLR